MTTAAAPTTDKGVRLTKEAIDAIFEAAREQGEYIVALYRAVYDDFDQRLSIDPPRASKALCLYCCRKAMEWDERHAVTSIKGGAWLNWGFSQDPTIKDPSDKAFRVFKAS